MKFFKNNNTARWNTNHKAEVKKTEGNNALTEMVFILDRSGSMSGLEKDTIGGFNSMIEKQKKEEGKAFVTTVLFDHEHEILHDRVDIQKLDPMTEKEYYVRGSTALIDTLGNTIEHISMIQKYARKEDVPAHTIFVITTDGMENASHEYSSDKVKKMIEQKRKDGWEFLFLGANIDAVETAKTYGISPQMAVRFESDAQGTAVNYKAVSKAMSSVRACGSVQENWSADIQADYASRKKH